MISRRKRTAVIGGGVAGLGAAWALRETSDVVVYDSAKRFGVNMDAYPRTQLAYEAALALPAVQRAVPEVQPDAPAP